MRNITTLMLLLGLIVSQTVLAVPAKPLSRTYIQPDGSKLTIILQGDAHFSYYATTDLVMLAKDKEGYMRYAIPDAKGTFVPGKYIACNPEERNSEVKTYIKETLESKIENALKAKREKKQISKLPGAIGSSQFPNKGEVRGVIILAEFKDQKFSDIGTQEEFSKMMNQEGYKNYSATGSARDYFIAQSHNTFFPSFDVVGPVSLPQNMEYYGKRIGNTADQNPTQMIVDACNQAKQEYNVDFSKYDLDNDGRVDLVYVIYAGYAEAQGAPDNTVWPHAWDISYGNKSLTLDGKAIRSYACSSELRNSSGTNIDGVGVFCHEFSHCLGLPDLYDAQGGSGYGLGYWSIMDRGCYNNDSKTPPNYSAFERYSVSWTEPEYLDTPQQNVTLEALDRSNKGYFIKSDKNENEYYILENRQPNGWDQYLPGHGLIITHVNYDPYYWTKNTVNTIKGKERVQIVPADNELSLSSGQKDAFPGTIGNSSFTDASTPAALLATGKYLNKPVTNITEKDGIIYFDFKDYLSVSPVLKDAANIISDGFTAKWATLQGVSSYTLEVAPYTTGESILEEDFSGFKTDNGNTDISGNLDEFTKLQGWTGNNIYQNAGNCYVGTTDNAGLLVTPRIDLMGNRTFTLCIEAQGSGTTASELQLAWSESPENYIDFANKNVNVSSTAQKTYWTFNADQAKGYLKIKANTQVIIKGITIYTGDVRNELEGNSLPPFNGTEQKQLITGITSSTYKVTGLQSASTYNFSVGTVIDDKSSILSKKKTVVTKNASGIETTESSREIYVSGNQLYISSQNDESVQIYTIDGKLMHTFTIKIGTNSVQLENGIYLIKLGNTTVKAIITK